MPSGDGATSRAADGPPAHSIETALQEVDLSESSKPSEPKAEAPVEPPDEYLCPITQELMRDPVIASDGHTYERGAIEIWFSKKVVSPKTGSALETSATFPNHIMRRQIIEWQEALGRERVNIL